MSTVLKYPGSKQRIAGWICDNMPPHDVYLEPYAGSLSVLLNKPRSYIETVNDIDGDIVNYFRVIRDHGDALKTALYNTCYARDEYETSFSSSETDDAVEKARRFAVRCWMGFGSSLRYQNGFKTGQQRTSPNPAKAWSTLPAAVEAAADRLRGVQIEKQPAVNLISRYNTADVFIYADPPYLRGIRKDYLYRYEMDTTDHAELLTALIAHPGEVMISGYENDLYNNMLSGWRKAHVKGRAEGGAVRIETIWMNYPDTQMSIFDMETSK